MSFDTEYVSKDTSTCEQCGHINIIKVKNLDSRKKRGHIVYCDDPTWLKIKKSSANYGTIGNFLAFLIKFFEAHEENFSVV